MLRAEGKSPKDVPISPNCHSEKNGAAPLSLRIRHPRTTKELHREAAKRGNAGLDYFGARYYGSKIGRFTTVDPRERTAESLIDPQRWNRYAYAVNNPLRYFDPDGRDTVWVKHANGTTTLVIPVKFSGSDATEANGQRSRDRHQGQ